MKSAAFSYSQAHSAAHAVELLSEHPGSRLIAGGQSLGPMLNLRLARPERLVDIRECPDLRRYADTPDAVVYGAGITHAEIAWQTVIPAAPERLWETLRDVPRMVEALPGAELTGAPDEHPLRLRLAVAIGPMRPSFDGEADASWDDATRSGRIEGRAHDNASRSSGEGRIRFRVLETPDAGGAKLELAIRYRIRGPLAQFSRGPVVDAVIEQLLARFAENLEKTAAGEAIENTAPPSGLQLLLAGIGSTIRRWFVGR